MSESPRVALKRKTLLSAMRVLHIRAIPRILFVFWQRPQLRLQFLARCWSFGVG